jgi:hypothetical protein
MATNGMATSLEFFRSDLQTCLELVEWIGIDRGEACPGLRSGGTAPTRLSVLRFTAPDIDPCKS